MSDAPKVGLVVWRDAKTEPPNLGSRVLVYPFGPAGSQVFAYRSGLDDKYKMWSEPHGTLDPQPSVWCDPIPPSGDDALTVEDLRVAAVALECQELSARNMGWAEVAERMRVRAARLRRALDSLERNTD